MLIRQAVLEDAKGIAKVHIESWKTTYKEILGTEYLDDLNYESRVEMWSKILEENHTESFISVAIDDEGQIVGFISGGKNRSVDPFINGELYAIYLLESFQRQGLGRQLMLPLVEFLQGQGIENMLVWVLKDNPSKQFYESLGARFYKEEEFEMGGKTLLEHGLVWSDLGLLKETLMTNI